MGEPLFHNPPLSLSSLPETPTAIRLLYYGVQRYYLVLASGTPQELPRHADPGWISLRAEDHACSIPTPPTSTGDPPLRSQFSESDTKPDPLVDIRTAAARGAVSSSWRAEEIDDGCVTLAVTTCKRLRGFLGTMQGLQVRWAKPRYMSHCDGVHVTICSASRCIYIQSSPLRAAVTVVASL